MGWRWARRAALFIGLACLGCGERPLEPRDPTPGAVHFKVKTYNVEAGEHGKSGTIEAVGADDADIVCLQETTPEYETVLRAHYAEQYPFQMYQHNLPNAGAAGLGILSRFPVIDAGWQPGPNGWHPAWHLFVETPAGTIQIMNVHLRAMFNGGGNAVSSYLSKDEDHLFEIASFMQACTEDKPTLVVGDFNEGVHGRAIEYLEDRGFRNALPLFRPGQHTWRHASVANQMTQTLDHILFDDSFDPLNAWVIDAGSSDHLPVVAHLEATSDWSTRTPVAERTAPRQRAAMPAR